MMHVHLKSLMAGIPRQRLVASRRASMFTQRQRRFILSMPRLVKDFATNNSNSELRARISEVWQNVRVALERQGDIIVTCANICQLSGFICSDALRLQTIMIFGNGGMAIFFLTRLPPMGVPFAWNFLKVCVNIYMVCKLTAERQPVKLTDEEFNIYEEHFMPYGITARQFKTFWDLGETEIIPPNTKMVVEGEHQYSVALVLSGFVFRTLDGEHIKGLDSFPGRGQQDLEGDAGAWIAEINALQMIDTISAPEAVSRDLYRRQVQRLEETIEDSRKLKVMASRNDKLEALKKFEEGFEADVGGLTTSVFSRDQVQLLLENSKARWTVHAGQGVVVRSWKLRPLLKMCKSSNEMSGMLRKAFSQSAIRKILATVAAKRAIPSGWSDEDKPVEMPGEAAEQISNSITAITNQHISNSTGKLQAATT
mmetsp:Transcript_80112/g.141868  ORF Transcript_80112/g.141868 Transcript_80112/m.141868 type:complete len:425 (+) Transcript_80112:90-1364(+)